MPARRKAPSPSTALRPVLACIPDPRTRMSVQAALRGHATMEWFETFGALRERVLGSGRSVTAVVTPRDSAGESALGLAIALRPTRAALVVCFTEPDAAGLPELARAGVHDVLLGDLADQSRLIRSVILGAAVGAAADMVLEQVAGAIPGPMVGFVELAIRRPRSMQRVTDVAAELRIPRQTLARWCRDRRYLKPEELLQWSRIFLIAALIQNTGWTAEAIARAMSYASATALRNRIRAYTGLTMTDIRARGIGAVKERFDERVAAVSAKPQVGQWVSGSVGR